jgi:hypothetical protein
MAKRTKAQEQERNEAIRDLRKMLRAGQTIYTIMRTVSRSGMQREISLAIVRKGEIVGLDRLVGHALRYRRGKHGGLVVGGCGMDMGFALVYRLGRTMWPDGTSTPHGRRNGEPDRDGGYALKHRWL